MLDRAAEAVRPGGRLVYATCSSEPEENEDVVAAFLARHPEFDVANPADRAPRGRRLAPVVDDGRPPADLPVPARARGVLRRGAVVAAAERTGTSPGSDPHRCRSVRWPCMALTTRVWSAGKLLLLVGALVATYVVSAALADARRAAAREVRGARSRRSARQRAPARRSRTSAWRLKVDEARRVDPKIAGGPDRAAGPARRDRGATAAQREGLGERRRQAPPVPRLVGETERTAQLRLQQDGLDAGARVGDPVERLPGRRRRRAGSAARNAAAAACRCSSTAASAATSYVMPDLIGVNGDRAADLLRGRGFRVAVVAQTPLPRRAAGHRHPPVARRAASRSRPASRFRSR